MPSSDFTAFVSESVQRQSGTIWSLARNIHSLAEPAFQEVESSRLLAEYLREHDFQVEFPFRNIPTAFRASWGRGKPVIGMLGEYDALPNCGMEEGAWGHGCGHNLLGTAPAAGAVAVKEWLQAKPQKGQIVYYGCPAEETLAGKVYMARDGGFRDLDAALAWHPSATTGPNNVGGSSLDSLVFEFFGRTAHGASAHHGRSALDGVLLLDVAANYLREHVPENVRIHSVIRSGGDAPNVVPAYAKSWYYVRGKNRAQVDEVRERLLACARGAAEATGTTMKWQRLTAIYERLPNDVLSSQVLKNLKRFGPPRPTSADKRAVKDALGLDVKFSGTVGEGRVAQGRGSTDEDSVSWITPLGRFQMACFAMETPGHHRNLAAQVAMPFAKKGLMQAAKVLAGTALDLMADPALLRRTRAEFKKRLGGRKYDPLVSKRQPVPLQAP